jgi:hypothetical protein
MLAHVITLRSRPDRSDHVQQAAEAMGLNYTLQVVDKHDNGVQGCFESHVNLIKSGARFIMEDDFEPTAEFFTDRGIEAAKEMYDFVSNSKDWDIFYLGFIPDILYSSSERAGKRIYKIRSWACTQAYIISDSFASQVSQWTWNGQAIDVRFREARSFSVHPQLVKQYDSPSDIRSQGMSVPLLRDVPQSLSSWWAMHVGVPLVHVAFALGVVVLLWILSKSHESIARNVLQRSLK